MYTNEAGITAAANIRLFPPFSVYDLELDTSQLLRAIYVPAAFIRNLIPVSNYNIHKLITL